MSSGEEITRKTRSQFSLLIRKNQALQDQVNKLTHELRGARQWAKWGRKMFRYMVEHHPEIGEQIIKTCILKTTEAE